MVVVSSIDRNLTLPHAFAVTSPSILAGIVPVSLWGRDTGRSSCLFPSRLHTDRERYLSRFHLHGSVYWLLD